MRGMCHSCAMNTTTATDTYIDRHVEDREEIMAKLPVEPVEPAAIMCAECGAEDIEFLGHNEGCIR